jgi:hypothetical protein
LPDDAVIDADALAKWLGKKRSWVIETANQRRRHKLQLPALKIGREWRFRVGDIRTWLPCRAFASRASDFSNWMSADASSRKLTGAML